MNEQEEETNIPAIVQTRAKESSQEVVRENVAGQNDQASLDELCNQTPKLKCPREAEVETANTTTTREPLMSSSSRNNMKFFVRNLEGHNDVICDVACSGSVLVSGRYVAFDHHLECIQVCLHDRCRLKDWRKEGFWCEQLKHCEKKSLVKTT